MHKPLSVKNHRGTTEVYYESNDENYLSVIEKEDIDLFIIDKALERFSSKTLIKIANKKTPVISIKAGEDSKMVANIMALVEEIENLDIHPISYVCVLGGGTIQDLAATCLGLLKRGTRWVFIPTTLLAQADSCIGGKTSLNSKFIKNLYGLFHAPTKIMISTKFLDTLSSRDMISGLGDALHYLYIDAKANKDLINESLGYLEGKRVNEDFFIRLMQECHRIKKVYIEEDEFDQSIRKILNLGHTFGHALETISEYKYPHGIAVLHGILHSLKFHQYLASENMNINSSDSKLIGQLFSTLKSLEEFPLDEIKMLTITLKNKYIEALMKDKKSYQGSITLILLNNELKPYVYKASPEQIEEYIDSDSFYVGYEKY